MPDLGEDRLEQLLRGFYLAYQERFEELAEDDDGPVPVLMSRTLDLVRVNGGRALHFFFTERPALDLELAKRVTRVHDIELWPGSTDELKTMEQDTPEQNREQVRKTADIDDDVYVHFIVYPEDGALAQILAHVAGLVAEREVEGQRAEPDVPAEDARIKNVGPFRKFDAGAQRAQDAADDWLHPGA